MGELLWAMIAFVGTHFLLSHPLRRPLVGVVGERGFQIVYSIVAIASFSWLVFAFRAAPRGIEAWPVGDGLWALASLCMLIGSIFFAGSFVGNPALANPGAAQAAAQPPKGMMAITRHPMMWGFALWGICHALVAPHQSGLILTLGLTFLAVAGSAGQDIKKARLMGEEWESWCAKTSFFPFARQLAGKSSWSTAWPGSTPVFLGILLWLGFSYLHPALGGPVAGVWRWVWG